MSQRDHRIDPVARSAGTEKISRKRMFFETEEHPTSHIQPPISKSARADPAAFTYWLLDIELRMLDVFSAIR
jgi:hypothetical protein